MSYYRYIIMNCVLIAFFDIITDDLHYSPTVLQSTYKKNHFHTNNIFLRALVTIITNFCVSAVYFILTLIKSTIKINSLSILNKIKMEKRTRHYHHRKVPVIKRFINKFQCSSQLILSSTLFLLTHTH